MNTSPITRGTDFTDVGASGGRRLHRAAGRRRRRDPGGGDRAQIDLAASQDVPIQAPPGGTTPDGVAYTYTANDASVGDLDGDGSYEIVLKWDPSNTKDNSQSGYTGNVFIDAYKLNGTRLWRIDLGRNIRAGAPLHPVPGLRLRRRRQGRGRR